MNPPTLTQYVSVAVGIITLVAALFALDARYVTQTAWAEDLDTKAKEHLLLERSQNEIYISQLTDKITQADANGETARAEELRTMRRSVESRQAAINAVLVQ